MSMILVLTSISDRNAAQILTDPPLIWRLLAPDDVESYLQEVEAQRLQHFLGRLFGKGSSQDAAEVPTLDLDEWEGASTDLDKAWHGIHYLLTQTAWEGVSPLNFLLIGGQEVPGVEVGYGRARIFPPDQVEAIHEALDRIDTDDLRARYDPQDMMAKELYPSIWDRDSADENPLGYCLEYFELLRRFVADCAARGLGFVVTIE